MKRVLVLGAALLWLAVIAAPAPAQYIPPGFPAAKPSGIDSVQEVKPASSPAADMQEDIEIMRRLLDGAFAKTYGFHGRKALQPLFGGRTVGEEGRADEERLSLGLAAQLGPHTEGVYLKDYGVVYTATLPPTGFDPLPASKPGSGSKLPPDDWDRIRKEIHGDAPTQENKLVPAHPPLSEVILQVLADNGKHFGALADGERISVAVTFRGAVNCTNCHQNPWPQDGPDVYFLHLKTSSTGGGGAPAAGTQPPSTGGSGAPPDAAGTPAYVTDARNAILLGDLHFKQGKMKEATDAYLKAVDLLGKPLTQHQTNELGLTREDVPALLTSVDMFNKLAAIYVQEGNSDAAANMLKKASDMAKKAEKLTGGAVTPTTPFPATGATAQALPSKLVVTVSKKQLDDMAMGRMTFEMFCQAAKVEYINPPVVKSALPQSGPGTIAP